MDNTLTTQTAAQFVHEVSHKSHAMAGAVIALSATQAAALGQACMRISRDELDLDHQAIDKQIDRLSKNIRELLQWCDRDATAIAEYVALREAGETLTGQQLLCQAPAAIGQISVQVASILQDFRPCVNERVQDDLEMAISLLAGTAQAAMLLLDSNLRIWPEPALLAQFEPIREELATDIDHLSPVDRIRE
ncbi:MAG: cyclodeaminase/cyclohydrolase family protein [Candidatus Promineifilaceae bacterium]